MSLREEIMALMPESVTDVKVERSNIKGLESIKVTTYFRKDDKPMYLMLNFAKKNQMGSEHIASVVKSYLRTAGLPQL
jgi:hypothetical protein